jgi:DNA polymerase-1
MEQFTLPNVRRLFQPDPTYLIADCDLDRADLQVVVWEADDDDLKDKLRSGIDVHAENAKDLNVPRPLAKAWVHGTNYGGSASTMARNCGITVKQADYMRTRWFQIHPGIKEWHDRTEQQLFTKRKVTNAFGFHRFYFDRIEGLLPQALAWIPQSTVAIITNKGILNLYRNLPQVQLLLQVHDSIVFQIPKREAPGILPQIREQLLITVPYPEPLIIPVGIKVSNSSWGEIRKIDWETGKFVDE